MKWLLYLSLFISSTNIWCDDSIASKGAVAEGLFILKNKHLDVQHAIQDLKKELTECFSKKEQKPRKKLEYYHCKLRQLLYPTYIDELSRLAARTKKDLQQLEKAKQIKTALFERMMRRAFLLDEKIALEKELITTIFNVDNARTELSRLQGQKPRLKTTIENNIDKIASLKSRLIEVNADLFANDIDQEVFFDKLGMFQRVYKQPVERGLQNSFSLDML